MAVTGGDAKTGCAIIAFILIVLSILAESKEFLFLIIFAIIIVAFLSSDSNSSSGNTPQNSQQYVANQGNEQYISQPYAE